MSKRALFSIFFAVVCLFSLSAVTFAQEITGSIVGTVRDANGAAVAGATVTITDPSKNDLVVRTVTTNEDGAFSVPNVSISTYTITVEAANFKKAVSTDVKVDVGQRRSVDISLVAGQINETVTVTADPVGVELTTPAAGTIISGNQVRELAINNRNFIQLMTLSPGVSSNLADQVYVGTTNPDGQANIVSISVNGARSSQNTFTVDGADITDRGSNLTIQAYPSVDSIGEFRVLRSLYPAESGRSGGGQINVVTRSGTDQFHGSLFEFVRNEKFNANSFFNNRNRPLGVDENGKAIRPPLRYHNYGFTVGGPVYFLTFGERDPSESYFGKIPRTFFFFSEEKRSDIRFPSLNSTVPNAPLRQGIFPIDICLTGNIAGSARTCSNILPAGTPFSSMATINPVSQVYLGIYNQVPLPNSPNPATPYNLSFPTRNVFKFQQEIFKIDTSLTDKISAYYRYGQDKIPTTEANSLFSSGSSLPGVSTTETNSPGRTHTLQATYVASPNFIIEGRYNRAYGAILSSNVGLMSTSRTTVPVNLAYPNQRDRIPTLTGTGFNGFTSFGPYNNFSTKDDLGGNVTYVFGNHTAKFGGFFSRYRKHENALAGSNEGSFSAFNNTVVGLGTAQGSVCAPSQQTATGACLNSTALNLQAFANFLQGRNATFSQAKADYTADFRQRNFELYAQDEFRIRPNLTLYYGLRYSFFGSPWDANGLLSNFVPELYNRANAPLVTGQGNRVVGTGNFCEGLIVNSQNFQTAPNGCNPTLSPYGKFVVEAPKTNFAPRVGIAWDPFGKGKTAIRTGYGIYHEQTLVGIFLQNLISNPPYQETSTLSGINLSDSFGTNPVSTLATLTVRGQDTNWKTPYMQHWSFDVQHQLTSKTLIDVGYYGSKGTNLIGVVDINLLRPGFATTQLCPVGSSTTPTAPCQLPGVPFTAASLPLDSIRPFRGYRAINIIKPMFNSDYHSLQVSAQHRFSGESQAGIAYTWSKNLTDNQTDRSTAPQNPYDIKSEYGRAQLDRRHVFTANYTYEIPFFSAQRGFVGKILGGWQASGIITYQTGLPFTATFSSYDPAGLGFLGPSTSGPRPNQIGDPNTGAPNTFDQWFNTGAFDPNRPLVGIPNVAGSAGRGTIHGPSLFRVDFTMAKNFRFTESLRLQLRAEAFNVLNKTNFTGFGTNPTLLGSYGIINGARDPRNMQFAAKFYF